MTDSIIGWAVAAILLFWAVGAYNRLVRLRATANGAFAAVETELARQAELVQAHLPPPEPASFWSALHAASTQLGATLSAARARPLDPERIAALSAAVDVLGTAWARAERDDAHDLAGPRMPDTLLLRRQQSLLAAHAASENFNQAVARYNEAIAQFPALLLAWLFGFRAARPLAPVIVPQIA